MGLWGVGVWVWVWSCVGSVDPGGCRNECVVWIYGCGRECLWCVEVYVCECVGKCMGLGGCGHVSVMGVWECEGECVRGCGGVSLERHPPDGVLWRGSVACPLLVLLRQAFLIAYSSHPSIHHPVLFFDVV